MSHQLPDHIRTSQDPLQSPNNQLKQPKKMFKYQQNQFSWEQNPLQTLENVQEAPQPPKKLVMEKPKINHLQSIVNKDRKFSCNQVFGVRQRNFTVTNNQIPQKQNQPIPQIPTLQNSIQNDSQEISEHPLENHPPQESPQSYFNKKMRSLQAKFKRCILQYETLVFKAKQENKNISHELNFYKKYLDERQPQIHKTIISLYDIQKEDRTDLLSDSSSNSSNQDNDEIKMPVNAQILEIKLEGHKWFEKIKKLEAQIKQINQPSNLPNSCTLIKAQIDQAMNFGQSMRKWSLHKGGDREKKQSFQTTLISQKSEQQFSEDLSASIQSGISQNRSIYEPANKRVIIQYDK